MRRNDSLKPDSANTINHFGHPTKHTLSDDARQLCRARPSHVASGSAGVSGRTPGAGTHPRQGGRLAQTFHSDSSSGIHLCFRCQHHQPARAGLVLGTWRGREFPQRVWLFAGPPDRRGRYQRDLAPRPISRGGRTGQMRRHRPAKFRIPATACSAPLGKTTTRPNAKNCRK